jgi:hypothetical protein
MLQLLFRWRALRDARDEMKSGDRYWRAVGDRALEMATVLDLRPDLVGIPHVHFSVAFGRSDAAPLDGGTRRLALSRFVGEYHKHGA